jgi:hypothetical protein
MIKQAIRRVYPGFNEGYYGFGSFSDLLEDVADQGLLDLEFDESRGNYIVRRKTARSPASDRAAKPNRA